MTVAPDIDPRKAGLQLRTRPSQARSRETFDRILRTAAELLEEVGWEGFNTNLLAKRSDIGVRALYRYFPNKLAVVSTLAQQMVEEWNSWFDDLDQDNHLLDDLPSIWTDSIDRFVLGLREMPGGLALRRAMAASPTLHAIDQRDNQQFAVRIGGWLKRRNPELSAARAKVLAQILIESGTAVIDLALSEPPANSRRLIQELKEMHIAYLESPTFFTASR